MPDEPQAPGAEAAAKDAVLALIAKVEALCPLAPQPPTLVGPDGEEENPAYAVVVGEYVEELKGFTPEDLAAAWRTCRASWEKRTWPTIAALRGWAVEAARLRVEAEELAARQARPKLPAPEVRGRRDGVTDAERAKIEAKTARAKYAMDWPTLAPGVDKMSDDEWRLYYLTGVAPERFKHLIGEEGRPLAAPEPAPLPEPALEARAMVQTGQPINAHWKACHDRLEAELPPDVWAVLKRLWPEYDDGRLMIVSIDSQLIAEEIHARCGVQINAILERQLFFAKPVRGRGYSIEARKAHYAQLAQGLKTPEAVT